MPIVTTSSRKRKSSKTPLFIILLVVVLAAAAYFIFHDKGTTPAAPEQIAVPEKTKPQTPTVETPKTSEPSNIEISEPVPVAEPRTNAYVKKAGQMMLPNGKVITFQPPKEGEFRTIIAHGKQYKCDSEGNWEDVTPKPIFDNSLEENLIGLSLQDGVFVPGMLLGLDKDAVMEILKRDVVINEDDSEDVVAKKEAVAEMKGAILDYIDQGGTFDQFVMEMRTLSVQERSMKGKALKKIVGLCKEGKIEEAKAYRESFNAVLEEQGFAPVKLPAKIRQAFGDTVESPAQK